jgi:hypothetical protein
MKGNVPERFGDCRSAAMAANLADWLLEELVERRQPEDGANYKDA